MRALVLLSLLFTSGQLFAKPVSIWEISGSLVSVTESGAATPFTVGDPVLGWFGIREVATPGSIFGPVEPRGAGLFLSVSGVSFLASPIWSPVSYPNDLVGYAQGMQMVGLPLDYLYRDMVISTEGDSQFGVKTGTLLINAATDDIVPMSFNLVADITVRHVRRGAAKIPEPGLFSMMSIGVALLLFANRRRARTPIIRSA
ncbi:hypothetical protein HNQ60_005140 [Povalibacter uvarum]|uniref:PEP-CTERM protein-sorting domain-containing protein n=1 Tax=Povalibacter uvarum TaxID=732238 RepID=A0A841HWD2_9GAMM|nr:PEP-CTERM sorting domain-containing protein [Povalibacter uvarum]MBB6096218.1 hypothetical protein [Povalibacter uvarum]